MEIVIKKRDKYFFKYLVFFQLIYVSFVQLLINLGLPSSLTLACDAINLLLLAGLIIKYRDVIKRVLKFAPFYIIYFLFFGIGTVTAVLYGGSLILWIWSIRNFGRFAVFFTAVLVFVDVGDYVFFKKILFVIGHVNFLLCIYQFVFLKLKGDYIGGVFGTTRGVANTWLNVFLLIFYLIALTDWLCLDKRFIHFVIVLIESFSIAVVGELKFFFVELVLVTLITMVFVKKTKKAFIKIFTILSLGLLSLCISVPILYYLFPFFKDFFHLETFIKTASESYTGTGDLGRLTAIRDISLRFFNSDPLMTLFGIGLGNGEYSEHQHFLQSEFYLINKSSNYTWFSDAIVMVQNGIVGVVLFVLWILYICMELYIRLRTNRKNGIVMTAFAISIITLFLFVYNVSLNCEIAYYLYAFMAFGLIGSDDSIKTKIHKKLVTY